MRVGILTSGGDCPGLNAVIRAVVLRGLTEHNVEVVGFRNGWTGVLNEDFVPLGRTEVRGLSKVGGTIIGTSRVNPYEGERGGPQNIAKVLEKHEIDGIIVIGGEGSLSAANDLHRDGINVIGVPKTIDNDLSATDYSFGFDTAVNIATEAMDRLRTTGDSHDRCMVAEVMGRHVGWIALHAGIAAGAQVICIPEFPMSLEEICEYVTLTHDRGRAPLVVVSEGFILKGMDEAHSELGLDEAGRPRLGGIGAVLAPQIQRITGIETRATVLGYIQRGGSPSGFDRVLATRLGLKALDVFVDQAWGQMVSLRGTDIVRVPLSDAVDSLNSVPLSRYERASTLFG
jgi:phosphofructokinase-like protein